VEAAKVKRSGASGRRSKIVEKVTGTLLLFLLLGISCDQHRDRVENQPAYGTESAAGETSRQYSLGILPMHNAVRLAEVFRPLVDTLNQQAQDFTVRLESSRDFGHFEEKMRKHMLDLALVNPYQAVAAEKLGYRIFAKLQDDDSFHGIIIVRKDAGIRSVQDLRGQVVSFPAPTALAATLMTKDLLLRQGLNVEIEAVPQYVGSHDSVVMGVYRGLAVAGGTWPMNWEAFRRERPEVIEALEIKWRTPPLLNMAVIVRRTVSEADLAMIATALFGMDDSEAGQANLRGIGIGGFEPANTETYRPVRRFLRAHARNFGKVPEIVGGTR
jgi:phosphonate transport system substrate-binding protein